MSEHGKVGIYVYQPFGVQHPEKWASGRIYGIGGLPMEVTCHGLTKREAEAVCAALVGCASEPVDRSESSAGLPSAAK